MGQLEIVDEYGKCVLVAIGDEQHALRDLAIRVLPIAGGVRIEPIRPGASLRIDGEDLFCKELSAGQSADVGRVRLRWLGEDRASAVTPGQDTAGQDAAVAYPAIAPAGRVAASARRSSSSRSRRSTAASSPAGQRLRPRPKPSRWPVMAITASLLLLAVFVVQRLSHSTWPRSPKYYVELAQIQYDNNRPERALQTLAFALSDATGDVHDQALALQEDIRRMMLENASALQVSSARAELELLQSFVATYLQSMERPAARECVRLCDVWLAKHREVCSWHSNGKPLLAEVMILRKRYAPVAAMETADTAADVVFAARSRMRFRWRDYKGAFARLDAFLESDPANAEVLAERERLLADGEPWLMKRLSRLDRTLERGDTDNAEVDLDELEFWVAIEPWRARIAERRQRFDAQR